jgi:uncharacterized membrane protein YdjX (TVP38/TMEM64 family)
MAEDGKGSGKASWFAVRKTPKVAILKSLFLLVPLLALPAIWSWTPLNQWLNVATIIAWQESVRSSPAAFYLVIGTYLFGSLVLFPVMILNVATVLTFGPILGNVYALVGWLASAAMTFGIGRTIGYKIVEKLAPPWLERVIQEASRHGFMTVLTLRIFPVAPFTVVNIFMGAWRIRFRDFFTATIVGRIPGIILLTLTGFQAENLLRRPGVMGVVLLGLTLLVVPLVLSRLSKRLLANAQPRPDSSESVAGL